MKTFNSIAKEQKGSAKSLRNLSRVNTKLRASRKSEKLSMKKTKRNASTSVEARQVKDDSKTTELNEVKLVNKKAIQHKPQGKNHCKFKEVVTEYHEDNVGNLELQINKSSIKNDQASKRGLKRKYSMKDDIKSKNIISGKNMPFEKVNRSSKENTDTLNLNDLPKEHILQCLSAIFHLTEEQMKTKNALFEGESQPVFMQITCIRVPKTPRRSMRILLPHSIVSTDDEVALFVGDLQRGRRRDYEPTIEHYEHLLRKHNCTRVKVVIPMNQVKTEYDQYELKRKLVSSYDHFLVDGKIAGHLSHLLGKEFYKKRKLPTSIRMQSKDLKHEIEHALKKTAMQLHSFGDTHIVQVGHTSMKEAEILENVLAVCKHLSKDYPGGWTNIRSIRIKTAVSLALPIYITLKTKDSVKVPVVQFKRPKAYCNVTGQLSTLSSRGAFVTVTPEGNVTVEKPKKIKKT